MPGAAPRGVGGWLLALCLMLTVVAPLISAWLMTDQYQQVAPLVSQPLSVQASVIASLALSAFAAAFGAYAGVRLWLIRPQALTTARRALWFGLLVDIVTTTLQVATAQDPADRSLLQVEIALLPSLAFFTLSLAYLNRSRRVETTYGSD